MSLASQIAGLHNQLEKLKEEYKELWRERTGSVRDPFKRNGDGGEEGADGMVWN